jgi:predicted transcriptional regulator of viral defense system
MATKPNRFAREVALFGKHGGAMRMAEGLRLGISRKTLYAMREAGVIAPLSRGLYRLADLDPLGDPDLVTVAARVPRGVVCLVSALAHHELTTQVPHAVDVALERGTTRPRLAYPPVRFYWFSGHAFSEGIETHRLDGVPVRIYGPEKTIVDCFRFRNDLGMEIVLEALRLWRARRSRKLDALQRYAQIRRVAGLMRPYLEAMA